ncbi:helix-turn-helix domain-containing protein [Streptomyces qinzhouensis]|uniref:Uncharacterized protein n=1 Tax=Streptomyces qinzhouensis TaxID=2599401 RepID=A0A5B8JQL4_9ACTN|nr:helix-turn-helix transcriptional regulator [Streptomyces qinzhouensis]QDY80200.1 hypothetical protein FQU76_30970 [Streptomyces qinzhouensis]
MSADGAPADHLRAGPDRATHDEAAELAGFYELIDSAIGACGDFRRAAQQVEDSLAVLRDTRRPGPPPGLLGGSDLRRAWAEFSAALRDVNSAVTHARAEGYRAAVDDGGISLTELARLSGHSRQQVTRLVNRGRTARGED